MVNGLGKPINAKRALEEMNAFPCSNPGDNGERKRTFFSIHSIRIPNSVEQVASSEPLINVRLRMSPHVPLSAPRNEETSFTLK